MPTITPKLGLNKPANNEAYNINKVTNENADILDEKVLINPTLDKETPIDTDSIVLIDSEDMSKSKKFSWLNIKSYLQEKLISGTNIKTINGESILGSGDIVIEGGSGGSNLYGIASERPTTGLEPGISFFATDLKRRLDFNGTNWQYYDGTLFGITQIVDGNIYPETDVFTPQTLTSEGSIGPQSVDMTKDTIIYTSFKLNDNDDYLYISFEIGTTVQCQIMFGYDWVSAIKDGVSISVIDAINSSKTLLGTKIMYDTQHQIVVWYDHRTGYINIYIDDVFINAWKPTSGANLPGSNNVKLKLGATTTSVVVNYWYVAKPLVVAIGDSITEGSILYSPNPEKYAGVDTYQGYPKNISDYLKLNGIKNYFVVNKGIGANTTAQMVSRFTSDVLNKNCKYVLIHGGINDYNDNPTGYSTPITNKLSMANTAKSNNIEPIILSVIPTKTTNAGHDFSINVHNLEKTAYSLYNYVDLWVSIQGTTENVADNAKMADDVHPNSTGYSAISTKIEENITV